MLEALIQFCKILGKKGWPITETSKTPTHKGQEVPPQDTNLQEPPKRKATIGRHSPPAMWTGQKTLLPTFTYLLSYLFYFSSVEKNR